MGGAGTPTGGSAGRGIPGRREVLMAELSVYEGIRGKPEVPAS